MCASIFGWKGAPKKAKVSGDVTRREVRGKREREDESLCGDLREKREMRGLREVRLVRLKRLVREVEKRETRES